jgi:hypothetical protein
MALTTRTHDHQVSDLAAGRWRRAWQETGPDDTILGQFLNSQSELNARLALAAGGRAAAVEGANLADSRSAVPYLNQAVLARPAPRTDDPVYDEIEAFFDRSPGGTTLLSLWPTADLWHRGWVLYGHPVLVAKSPVLFAPSRPEGVDIEVVTDPDGVARAEGVLIDGYPVGEPGDPSTRPSPGTVLPAGVLDPGCTVRLAWLDGEPVATGLSYGPTTWSTWPWPPPCRRRGAEACGRPWCRPASATGPAWRRWPTRATSRGRVSCASGSCPWPD